MSGGSLTMMFIGKVEAKSDENSMLELELCVDYKGVGEEIIGFGFDQI